MAKKKNAVDEQLKKSLRSIKAYAAGKTALKTTILSPTGEKIMFQETLPEAKVRQERLRNRSPK